MAPRLYRFQEAGVDFLLKVRRAILGDDMGLGKTAQAIMACEELGAMRVLVICPNTLKSNWAEEIKKWTPHRGVSILRGTYKKRQQAIYDFWRGFLVVNIEIARWTYTYKKVENKIKRVKSDEPQLIKALLKRQWDVIIVDEAHSCKNRKADQTEGVRELCAKTKHVYFLTGTPIMNRVDDLWSPLNILYPKRYYSFWSFVRRHAIAYKTPFGWKIDGKPIRPKELRTEIAPVLLRREKEEVFPDMPRRIHQKLWLDLEGEQLRIYRDIEKTAMAEIDEDTTITTVGILARLTRCRQVAVSPWLIGSKFPEGVKLDALMGIIDGTDQKMVVFSTFAEAIKLVSGFLEKKGIDHTILIGEKKEVERHEAIKHFQSTPKVQVFLATIQAGGAGINLTAASLVVFLDKHWTPAVNEQAIDRTRPHMQTRPIQVIELLGRNTVDEIIEGVLAGKVSIVEAILKRKKEIEKCQK